MPCLITGGYLPMTFYDIWKSLCHYSYSRYIIKLNAPVLIVITCQRVSERVVAVKLKGHPPQNAMALKMMGWWGCNYNLLDPWSRNRDQIFEAETGEPRTGGWPWATWCPGRAVSLVPISGFVMSFLSCVPLDFEWLTDWFGLDTVFVVWWV